MGVEPEGGKPYQLGVKYQPAGTNALLSAAIYDLRKNNVTVAVVQPDGNIDVIASYSWMKSEVVRSGPIRGVDVDVEGNEFSEVPRHMASLWVNYTLPGTQTCGDMTFGLGARYVGSYYFAISNDTGKADASVTLDAAFSYAIQENTSLAVNVSTLLDLGDPLGQLPLQGRSAGRLLEDRREPAF